RRPRSTRASAIPTQSRPERARRAPCRRASANAGSISSRGFASRRTGVRRSSAQHLRRRPQLARRTRRKRAGRPGLKTSSCCPPLGPLGPVPLGLSTWIIEQCAAADAIDYSLPDLYRINAMAADSFEHLDAQVNGVRLHVAAAGPKDGPLLIFLHGFPEFWHG